MTDYEKRLSKIEKDNRDTDVAFEQLRLFVVECSERILSLEYKVDELENQLSEILEDK